MDKPNISFFCPAYYDEKNLPRLIPEVVSLLSDNCGAYEILIIEDCSPDQTGAVADSLAQAYPEVRVIHHKKNAGYGATIAEGFREANKFEWVFYTDGDRQYDVVELKELLKYTGSTDAVIGYRRDKQLSWYRKLQSGIYNALASVLFGLAVKDIDCSMKLIKRSYLDKIELRSTSALIDAELLIKLRGAGARFAEAPVRHLPRDFGKASGAKPAVVLKTVWELFKLRLGML